MVTATSGRLGDSLAQLDHDYIWQLAGIIGDTCEGLTVVAGGHLAGEPVHAELLSVTTSAASRVAAARLSDATYTRQM